MESTISIVSLRQGCPTAIETYVNKIHALRFIIDVYCVIAYEIYFYAYIVVFISHLFIHLHYCAASHLY